MPRNVYVPPEADEPAGLTKTRERLDAQLDALNTAREQHDAKREDLEGQLADETFASDLADTARQLGRERIELCQMEIGVRRALAAEWFPARSRHRAAVTERAWAAHGRLLRDVVGKVAALGFDQAQAEHFACFHPAVAALSAEARDHHNQQTETSDVIENNKQIDRLTAELAKLAREAMAAV